MVSDIKFKIIDYNKSTQLENALVDIVVQQLIRKEESLDYIREENETC